MVNGFDFSCIEAYLNGIFYENMLILIGLHYSVPIIFHVELLNGPSKSKQLESLVAIENRWLSLFQQAKAEFQLKGAENY